MDPNDLRQLGQEYDLAMPPARTLRALSEEMTILEDAGGMYTIVSENGVYEFDPEAGCSCPDAEHNGRRCKHERTFEYRTTAEAANDLQAEIGAALLDIHQTIEDLEAELRRLQTAKWTLERHLDTVKSFPSMGETAAPAETPATPAQRDTTSASEAVVGD